MTVLASAAVQALEVCVLRTHQSQCLLVCRANSVIFCPSDSYITDMPLASAVTQALEVCAEKKKRILLIQQEIKTNPVSHKRTGGGSGVMMSQPCHRIIGFKSTCTTCTHSTSFT